MVAEESSYKPTICPVCEEPLFMESNKIDAWWFNREVYCSDPNCTFEGGVETYKRGKCIEGQDGGECPKCTDEHEEWWVDLEATHLEETDDGEDFEGDYVFIVYKCPECGLTEKAKIAVEFDSFTKGETLFG